MKFVSNRDSTFLFILSLSLTLSNTGTQCDEHCILPDCKDSSFDVRKPSLNGDRDENIVGRSTKMSGRTERTFLAVKPDGVQRGLVGEVIKRFEQRGYKLVAMKMVQADEKILTEHYKEHEGKGFFKGLLGYMSSGPVVAMVFEGTNVIKTARAMLGATKPQDSAPGTLRGDFCIDVGRNLVHGSDSLESAAREIGLWFTEQEICKWTPAETQWVYE